MQLKRTLIEGFRTVKNPLFSLPMVLFSVETFYLLFDMLVPQYMPGFGNAIFLIFPEVSDLLYLLLAGIIVGSFLLGAYPSLASGKGVREAFRISRKRYVHTLLSLLIELLVLLATVFLAIRVSGFALSVASMSVSYVYFYLSLLCVMALIAVLFIYTLPSVVLGGKNFLSAIYDSIRLSAKNYPKSLALFALPAALLVISFFALILLPFSLTTEIVLVRFFMFLFVIVEAFMLSLAVFLFSFGYINS